jgi:diguanylate cyclase (GGDEF)-like protein
MLKIKMSFKSTKENRLGVVKKLVALLTLAFCIQTSPFVYASYDSDVDILVLLSFNTSLPWTKSYLRGLDQVKDRYNANLNYYIEVMDAARIGDSMTDDDWLKYLQTKYHKIKFDAAIAESAKASLFLNRHGEALLGKSPIVYYTGSETKDTSHTKTLKLQEDKSVENTLSLALNQNPASREIVIIDGSDADSRNVMRVLLPRIKKISDKRIKIIKDFTLDELIQTVSRLPSDSILIYNLVFKDRTGKKFVPKEVLKELAQVSPAPIYSFWSSLMGSGVIGGHMIDGRETAIKTIEAVMDYLALNRFRDNYDTLITIVDWSAIERYGIDPNSIPKSAEIIRKPTEFLEIYAKELRYLIYFIVFFVVLTGFWLKKLTELNKKLLLEKARAENLARTDVLTGLSNRRAFFEMSVQACNEAKRLRLPISVMLLDIDYFKKVNDTYGHAAGDRVLKYLAKTIKSGKRDMDIAARFGGEEFILLLPFSDAEGSKNLAERIRKECEKAKITYEGKEISITLSAGIYSDLDTSNPCSISDSIQYADNALYMAKRQGRNQTVISPNSYIYQSSTV